MTPRLNIWSNRVYINNLQGQGHAKVWFELSPQGVVGGVDFVVRIRSNWHTGPEICELVTKAQKHLDALNDGTVRTMREINKLAREQDL